jgi:transposase
VIVERCAALDVRRDVVSACVRRPGPKGREQEVREFCTSTSSLCRLRDWLAAECATQVAMEATGVHWRPIWHALELLEGVDLLLVNAHHVRTLPGRRTDVDDACWLAQLVEYGLLRGSVVPPCNIARLRDVTGYWKHLVEQRATEAERVQKAQDPARDEHDALMLAIHLAHIDHLTAAIDRLDEEVQRLISPFAKPVLRRCIIPAAVARPR